MPPDTDKTKAKAASHPILIVDDEEIVLVALRDTLVYEGYEVVASPSPLQALETLKKQEFAAVITDQQMPRMTGLEFLAHAKQLQPEATRILVTAVLNLNTVIDAINQGEIYRFVVKPWLREELLAAVKNGVQRYELHRSNARLQAETQAANEKLIQLNENFEAQVAKAAAQNERLGELARAQEDNLHRSVELCVHMIQTFYPTLGNQARRVYELCKAMGKGLNLPPEQQQTLEIAAWIHDIGLVGVPRQLIRQWEQKPESLTAAEQALLHHHPVLGEELARFAHHLQEVGKIIRGQHERFDGTGYPDKLKGEEIPWLARLLGVAVAYAESHLEPKAAAEFIGQGSGSAFDPEAVRSFLRSLPKAVVPGKQREVLLTELRTGMVLAEGVYTETGILLMPDGQELTEAHIDKLRNHHRINPIMQSLLIYC